MRVKTGAMLECAHCTEQYYVPRCRVGKSRYCSKACFDAAQTTSERRELRCERCETLFVAPQDHGNWPRFCSRACFQSGAPQPTTKRCPVCDSAFLAERSSHHGVDGLRIYCSKKCRDEGKKTGSSKVCVCCGNEFYLSPAAQRQRGEESCCSKKCAYEFYTREQSASWKGGEYIDSTVGDVRVNFPRAGWLSDWVGQHRLVATKAIGRMLKRTEPVLHIDGNKRNNDPSNLFICASLSEAGRRREGSLPWPRQSNLAHYEPKLLATSAPTPAPAGGGCNSSSP